MATTGTVGSRAFPDLSDQEGVRSNMSGEHRRIQEPGEWTRRDYNEERKGNDMVDPRPAQPREPSPPGEQRPPVVVQDLPD